MERQKKKQKGITLIALVISIIVMLILAGVSLNMTIGENGIITQAQNATYQNSIAILEEFFQQYYVSNFDTLPQDAENKVEAIQMTTDWIYNPMQEGIGGLRYIVNREGNKMYLIQKSNLPKDIQEGMRGGDAGEGSYQDYLSLNDVYGVTSQLKVYYCLDGIGDIKGVDLAKLDMDDPLRVVYDENTNSNFYNLLSSFDNNKDRKLSFEELKGVTEITIDSTSGISNLNELYNLINLKSLTLKDMTLENLKGIQNTIDISYLCFYNCTIGDYSQICSTSENLEYLYLENTTDEQVNKLVLAIKDYDFKKLQYFGIFNSLGNVNNLDCLSALSPTTKMKIKYLYLYNNNLSNVLFLNDYTGLVEINLRGNQYLTTLDGLNSTNLTVLSAKSCGLGKNEVYNLDYENYGKSAYTDSLSCLSKCPNIKNLDVSYNSIIWTDYINSCSNLEGLHLDSNNRLAIEDLKNIKDLWNRIKSVNRYINSKYLKYLTTEEEVDLYGQNLENDSEDIVNLYNNTDVKVLRLDGNNNLNKEGYSGHSLNEILKTCTSMEVLSLEGLTNLTSADFLAYMPNLKYLNLWDCSNINDLSVLENNCPKLTNLFLNNSRVDLTKFQTVISRLNDCDSRSWYGPMYSGFVVSKGVIPNINNCKNITNLRLSLRKDYCEGCSFDLSGCTSLLTITINYSLATFKFPSNLTNLGFMMLPTGATSSSLNTSNDFSLCKKLTSAYLQFRLSIDNDFGFSTLNNCTSLESLALLGVKNSIFDFSYISNLTNLKKLSFTPEEINTYKITLKNCRDIPNCLKVLSISNFKSIEGLTSIGQITDLSLAYNNLLNLNFINNSTYLQNLTVNNNSISSLIPLIGCSSLVSLNLNTNLIYDTSTDETGRFNNLEIIKDLHEENNLKSINLGNNSKIGDWSVISLISGWNDTTKTGW